MKLLQTTDHNGSELTICADKIIGFRPSRQLVRGETIMCTDIIVQAPDEEGTTVFMVREHYELVMGKLTKL